MTDTKKLEYQLQTAKDEKNNILLKSLNDFFRTGEVRKDTVQQLVEYDNCINKIQQRIYDAADKR